jgi:hypothetical protein
LVMFSFQVRCLARLLRFHVANNPRFLRYRYKALKELAA